MLHMGVVRVQAMATVAVNGFEMSIRGQMLTWAGWLLDTDARTDCSDKLTCAFATFMDMHGIGMHRN